MPPRSTSQKLTHSLGRLSRSRELERIVHERITVRLGRRIRRLSVEVDRGVIRLTGQCCTAYSKQLAQHAALGIVEDEVIENRIEIAVPFKSRHG